MQDTPVSPLDLNQYPLNDEKVQKLKPKIMFDKSSHKFKLLINIPGYKKDDIKVFAGNDKIMVKAADRMQLDCINICKVYEAEYSLPAGIATEKLWKRYHNGVLCVRGDIKQTTANDNE